MLSTSTSLWYNRFCFSKFKAVVYFWQVMAGNYEANPGRLEVEWTFFDNPVHLGVVVAACLVFLLLFFVLLMVIFIKRRNKNQKKSSSDDQLDMWSNAAAFEEPLGISNKAHNGTQPSPAALKFQEMEGGFESSTENNKFLSTFDRGMSFITILTLMLSMKRFCHVYRLECQIISFICSTRIY